MVCFYWFRVPHELSSRISNNFLLIISSLQHIYDGLTPHLVTAQILLLEAT